MNRRLAWLALSLALTLAVGAGGRQPDDPPERAGRWRDRTGDERPAARLDAPLAVPRSSPARLGAASGHIVVRFREEVPRALRPVKALALGAERYRPARFAPFARVDVPPGGSAAQLVASFQASPDVAWAELDPPCYAAMRALPAAASFDDPLLPRQWHHERIGLLAAFDRNPRLGEGVAVAVIDTGVAFGNGAAFPQRRGLDLDGTAFVPGWDFVDDDPLPFDEGSRLEEEEAISRVRFGHGTFAAAQIAATVGNGVAGIGIAPRAAIMPLRVLGVDGSGSFSDVAEAIDFAVANGARVINMSLGGPDGSRALEEAVRRASARGAVLVAAAGNEQNDEDEPPTDVGFPARLREVIAVGATDFEGRVAPFSNRGSNVELVAPSGDDNAEIPGGRRDGTLSTSFIHDPATGQTTYSAFWATGTSFASPQVAGAAALLISLGVVSPEGVRIMLRETVDDVPPAGFDTGSGFGELDVLGAHLGVGLSR